VALDRMDAVRDDAAVGLLAVDLRLAVPVLQGDAGEPRKRSWKLSSAPPAPPDPEISAFRVLELGSF